MSINEKRMYVWDGTLSVNRLRITPHIYKKKKYINNGLKYPSNLTEHQSNKK